MTAEQEAVLVNAGLTAIGKVIELVRSAQDGAVSPDEALASIVALHDSLVAKDTSTDRKLHDRFDKGG